MTRRAKDPLLALPNLGPALRGDLARLGVDDVPTLAAQDPDDLYRRLGELDGRFHDPCVWDQLASVIHIAGGGDVKPWWAWTPVRKARQAAGDFPGAAKR